MNRLNGFYLKVLVVMILCLVLSTGSLYSYMPGNGAGGGYCDPVADPDCVGSDDSSNNNSTILISRKNSRAVVIESFIEEAGGYFLNSLSHIMALSNRVEMSNLNGLDYSELQKIVNDAQENIRSAIEVYSVLIEIQESTPYNQAVIAKLKTFAYHDFMLEHSLNRVLFEEVERFLKNGDITGTFKRMHNSCVRVEALLVSIQNQVSDSRMPELSDLWKVNEEASSNLLFGQCISRIFYSF